MSNVRAEVDDKQIPPLSLFFGAALGGFLWWGIIAVVRLI